MAAILRHSDFERIRSEFMKYYCQGVNFFEAGEKEYVDWLTRLNLDQSKSYVCFQQKKFGFPQTQIIGLSVKLRG